MTRHRSGAVPPPEPRPTTYTIYARVLLHALEDLAEPKRARGRDFHEALAWFERGGHGGLLDVEMVCEMCQLKTTYVYREVKRRLRKAGVRSRRITEIRWGLRAGRSLREL